MRRFLTAGLFTTLLVAVSATSPGCAGKAVDENDPGSLYQDAEEEIKSEHYQVAVDKLRMIRNKFPYSKYAVEAQLRIADVYFLQESYSEAASAYETFRDLHPKHEKVPYAMFRIGKAYQNDMPGTVARDLGPGTKALEAYEEFLRRFPSATEADQARQAIADIRKALAEKELYIANFYLKQDQHDSARARYEKILRIYSDTPPANEARKQLESLKEKTNGSNPVLKPDSATDPR